jgi:hypothetical protein
VLFVVVTDGQENASRWYDRAKIQGMIEHQQSRYSWGFVYLGANVDAFAEAGAMGIPTYATAQAVATPSGTRALYSNVSANVGHFRGGQSLGSLNWSPDELQPVPPVVLPSVGGDMLPEPPKPEEPPK